MRKSRVIVQTNRKKFRFRKSGVEKVCYKNLKFKRFKFKRVKRKKRERRKLVSILTNVIAKIQKSKLAEVKKINDIATSKKIGGNLLINFSSGGVSFKKNKRRKRKKSKLRVAKSIKTSKKAFAKKLLSKKLKAFLLKAGPVKNTKIRK